MWVKTCRQKRGVGWWASETPQGAATVAFRVVGAEVCADAWGPGAEWAIERVPALLGGRDDPSGFRPHHRIVAELVASRGVPRLGATGRWFEALATAAVYQRVVSADARSSVTRMGRRFGTSAEPGAGCPLPLMPLPEVALRVADHDYHRVGIDRARARVVRVAAKHAARLEALDERPPAESLEWLQRLPGVGPWTAARTTGAAAGDPDAVPVGDLHVPRSRDLRAQWRDRR